ncbi:hypothetical protein APR12_000744 [Nocardia amikacinitolerans]|uniref:hypothetical protein n=1 Tax=Nocardia amikacinitolerans TaxID=756689 RepID=UPI000829F116|nr:hypothetical protein [Nocardia amikacinitolerans]MCP2315414.1 hypothetical protein [Nocardia amikacinitolerans]
MERGNSKHGPKRDDQLAHELEGALKGNRSTRADEWRDPEPLADDDEVLTARRDLPRPAPPDNPQP